MNVATSGSVTLDLCRRKYKMILPGNVGTNLLESLDVPLQDLNAMS